VLVGLRPLPFVGAELEYIDFGNAGGNDGYYHNYYDYGVSAHPKATVLYGLGYLPLPLPFLDVYGKLGVARLQTDNSYFYSVPCASSTSGVCAVESRFDQQNTKFAYGAGVQAKWQDFAVRGEYERISSSYGDPNTVMVSLTWTF
jgi:opacity protein-like surface antigen